jgi:predicted ATPase/class 3 adenylate cyclase
MSDTQNAPTGTLTLVFTDIQGSTALWEHFGDDFNEVLALHNQVFREAILCHGGYEVKTEGDAFMVAFPNAHSALDFCMDLQTRLHDASWPKDLLEGVVGGIEGTSKDRLFRGLRVRMGIHTGEPWSQLDPTTGRIDYFGRMVNRAARLAAVPAGGQVVVSQTTWLALSDEAVQYSTKDLKEHALKGLERREHLWQILPPRFKDRIFPALRTADLQKTNLPARPSLFVGRNEQTLLLEQSFSKGARFVTLLGGPGTGKSRLAQRYGATHLDGYPGGVWLCDLATAKTREEFMSYMAVTLEISIAGGDPISHITNELNRRGKTQMILDNIEHLLETGSDILLACLHKAPETILLCTSRSMSHIEGEEVIQLEPLPLPAARRRRLTESESLYLTEIEQNPGIELFVARAQSVKKSFSLSVKNAPAVIELVRQLDGVPLAIELAAARVQMFPPETILKRLTRRFELLGTRQKNNKDRQSTLKGAIDLSWDLLKPWERSGLAQCSVFRGGFSLEAAESILDLEQFEDAPWAVDIVQSLLEQSLIRTTEASGDADEYTYQLLSSIQAYAEQKLLEKGTEAHHFDDHCITDLKKRHALFFSRLGHPDILDSITLRADRNNLLRILEGEANLRVACEHAVGWGDAKIAFQTCMAIAVLTEQRGPLVEGIRYLDSVLAMNGLAPEMRLEALTKRALLYRRSGDMDNCAYDLRQARKLARSTENNAFEGRIINDLAWVARWGGHDDRAAELYAEALAIAQQHNDSHTEGLILSKQATLLEKSGDVDKAHTMLQDAIVQLKRVGDKKSELIATGNLANLQRRQGQLKEAFVLYQDILSLCRETNNIRLEAYVLTNLAELHLAQDEMSEAYSLFQQATDLFREVGDRGSLGYVLSEIGALALGQNDLTKASVYIDEAGPLLREANNQEELTKYLCRRGLLDLANKDIQQAQLAHQEVTTLMKELPSSKTSTIQELYDTFTHQLQT